MNRNDYLTLCQKASMYPEWFNIRQNIPENLLVTYDSIAYYPDGYILKFNRGFCVHTAILHDVKANSSTRLST